MRTANQIEETKAQNGNESKADSTLPVRQKKHKLTPKMIAAQWKPGQSGNPGGKPKRDLAKEIAQAIFENNPEKIYQAYCRILFKGNAYAFNVLSERAYGKLKEFREVAHLYPDVSDADLAQRIADLERDLGLARAIDEAGRTGITAARSEKANGKAENSDVLS